jgi:uncharacterized membrane protein
MSAINRSKTALALAYPFVAHAAIVHNSAPLIAVALALLTFVPMLPALSRGRLAAWLAVPPIAIGLWWLSRSMLATLPLYIAPVLVPGFMACVFGSTLTSSQMPLIERLIRIMLESAPEGTADAEPDPAVRDYARRLTIAWTVFFMSLATVNLVLGLLAQPGGLLLSNGITPPVTVPQQWWSLFANMIGYLLVAAFFLIEYAYRRQRFPRQPYRNMLDFFVRMLAAMPRLVGDAAGSRR